ncbi:probable H/ACA ribonucleoprotein complex subunit 1 isoform X2 [Daktulosphaira vitifoliae]|nr:probable H/ACA ribonucleoprotein complex subunit 1 isoform X2 [Daktulosphaira vitifoliae]
MSFTFYVYANENSVVGNPPLVVRGSKETGRGGSNETGRGGSNETGRGGRGRGGRGRGVSGRGRGRDGREKKFGGSCNFCQLKGHKAANCSAKGKYLL